jgi:hypothetical protein
MAADRHTFPLAQDAAGRIFINHRLVWSEDTGLLEHDLQELGCKLRRVDGWWHAHLPGIVASEGDADTLKLSGLRKFRIFTPLLDGRHATEDALDVNHCEEVEITVDDLHPAQKYAGTIKGASRGIVVHVARQHGRGLWDFGNFSDQGNEKTTGCALDITRADNGPVEVRALSADVPHLLNSERQAYSVQRLNQGWFYPLFNFLKDLARLIGLKL